MKLPTRFPTRDEMNAVLWPLLGAFFLVNGLAMSPPPTEVELFLGATLLGIPLFTRKEDK